MNWFRKKPEHVCPVPEWDLPLTGSLPERLAYFLSQSHRPYIRVHAISHLSRSTWDDMVEAGWDVLPDNRIYGWVVDTRTIDGSQAIVGAVSRTLEEALVYSEKELMKLHARYGK